MHSYYIGIDLGGTNIKGSIFDENMNLVLEQRLSTEASYGSEHVLERIHHVIDNMMNRYGVTSSDIKGIGMGIPGLLNMERGISLFSPNFSKWENVPIVDWFQEKLHIPVFIDNDVRVNLYGEWHFGAGKGSNHIVLLTIGTGLGSGIVMDGRVLYGATGSAGEIGHMNMYREGRPCKCGSSGCFGRYVSALGILRTLKEKIDIGYDSIITEWVHGNLDDVTAKMVSEAYDVGDLAAVETLHETGEILGFGLTNIINLYNPEIIIIGGGVAAAGERLLSRAREVVDSHALKISNSKCTIKTARLGDAAGMLGAAIFAKERLETRMQ